MYGTVCKAADYIRDTVIPTFILHMLWRFYVINSTGSQRNSWKTNRGFILACIGSAVGLAVYMAFQLSAADGDRYIFRIDLNGLADLMTWVYALGQAFFSLSLAGNGTLIYGSYLDDRVDVTNAAWKVALFHTLAALLAALVIIPAMATAGSRLDEGGPGLIFIHLPNLFKFMPGSRILIIVFFTAILFAGISSLINLFEAFAKLHSPYKFGLFYLLK